MVKRARVTEVSESRGKVVVELEYCHRPSDGATIYVEPGPEPVKRALEKLAKLIKEEVILEED